MNERETEENGQKRTENGKVKIGKLDVQYCVIYTNALHTM
jgi:hypothetical protein